MDKSGNIKAVVIGVGGFLGMGSQLVAVPFDKIKFVDEPVAYTGLQRAQCAGHPSAFDHDDGRGQPTAGDSKHGKAESLVSRSRGAQRDQGRFEGDARVQIFDGVTHEIVAGRSDLLLARPDGKAAARPFYDSVTTCPRRL
jgi:hypothetical protein